MTKAEQEAANGGEAARRLAQRFDQDRSWSAQRAPEPARRHLLALYAFDVELARIPFQVSDPLLGEVRLRWWRDLLDVEAEGEGGGHSGGPIADALAEARRAHDLPHALLTGMIEARVFDLNRDPMPDMEALRRYLQATSGAAFALACRILGVEGEAAAQAAAHGGMAWGLTGLMRSLPVHASRGQIFLPETHLRAHDVKPRSLLRGEETVGLTAALKTLRAAARRSLALCRRAAAELPPEAAPAFLHLAVVEAWLDRLGAPGLRPLRDVVDVNPLRRYWRIVQASARGGF